MCNTLYEVVEEVCTQHQIECVFFTTKMHLFFPSNGNLMGSSTWLEEVQNLYYKHFT